MTDNREAAAGSRLVNIDTVARRLGVNVRHVRRLVGEHRIPYIKWGRLLRFDTVELERWLDARRVHADGETATVGLRRAVTPSRGRELPGSPAMRSSRGAVR